MDNELPIGCFNCAEWCYTKSSGAAYCPIARVYIGSNLQSGSKHHKCPFSKGMDQAFNQVITSVFKGAEDGPTNW